MLQLTPLDQTVAGKQLIQRSLAEGIEKGELIGEIHMAQRVLKRPQSAKEELIQMNLDALRDLLRQLEADLD